MDKRQDLIKIAKQIVEFIYQGRHLPFSENDMTYIFPFSFPADIRDRGEARFAALPEGGGGIEHREYRQLSKTDDTAVVAGRYAVMGMQFFVTVILNISAEKVRIIHVHISSIKEERFYHVRDVNARQFRLRESEIFYLEARHNHVLWNCENVQLETVGSFKETEKSLSEEFVRIHRGFIVNRQRVCKIARCYAELDNGKTLQIPVKKYMEVKKALQGTEQ